MAETASSKRQIDPKTQAVARIYAEALLDASPEGQTGAILEEFGSFVNEFLKENRQFEELLRSAMISSDEKLEVLQRTVSKVASPTFANFLSVVAQHNRLEFLDAILDEAQRAFEVRSGEGRVLIKSARPLTAVAMENIQRQLSQVLPFRPILEVQVVPELLGGLIIRVGDTVYDGSLRTRMKNLRVRLRSRSLHEIQSGRDRFSHSERD